MNGSGRHRYDPTADRWEPLSVAAVGRLLVAEPRARAWLSGGVALDHRLGRLTRPHGDVDVSVLEDDWERFAGAISSAGLRAWWAVDGVLERVTDPVAVRSPNVWCRTDGGAWAVQVNLERGDAREWRYRRDPSVRLPWRDVVSAVDGVPTVRAAVQLLWKAARRGMKDTVDRDAVLDMLTATERDWLATAVARAHPSSPWLRDGSLRNV